MKKLFLLLITIIYSISLFSEIIEVSGEQSGVWNSGNIYEVIGDIEVLGYDSLRIEPGVIVKFMDYYKMEVYGNLQAVGTVNDSITFTSGLSVPNVADWTGIHFYAGNECENRITHAKLLYTNVAVYCDTLSKVLINYSRIQNYNQRGIRCVFQSEVKIISNEFPINANYHYGVYASNGSMVDIFNNYFTLRGVCSAGDTKIVGNIFYDPNSCIQGLGIAKNPIQLEKNIFINYAYGISCGSDEPIYINNNIFIGNECGIVANINTELIVEGNTFISNGSGIVLNYQASLLECNFNCFFENFQLVYQAYGSIPPGIGEITTTNNNGTPCDQYQNIFIDPLIVNPEEGDYRLMYNSPCIDAGDPELPMDPDGTISDIGAFFFNQLLFYGDIDDNDEIQAFDASIVLQYIIGLDPIPEIDPIPWEEETILTADVDGNEEIQAYDASLILQYVVGIITEFSVMGNREEAPQSNISVIQEGNALIFSTKGNLFSFELELEGMKVEDVETKFIYAVNDKRIALASAEEVKGEFLRITMNNEECKINDVKLKMVVNTEKIKREIFLLENDNLKFPNKTVLHSAYPNPFNPKTTIKFSIQENETALFEIFNVKGQTVKSFPIFNAGNHEVNWNGTDDNGNKVSSGVFFYKLKSESVLQVRKLLLLK